MNLKFSAVTITRNEEERIGRWLRSVSWCDEKIVVDDDSSDRTRQIAARFGAKVIRKIKDTEATQWRYALSLAKGDWIIWGGADQWLDKELIKDIKKRVGKEEFVGYMVTMQELFLGQKLKIKESKEYRALWVMKRNAMKLPKVLVHQSVEVDGKVGVLKGVMYHDSFRSFDQIFSKFNYYTTLQALEAFNQGKTTSLFRVFFAPIYTFLWRQIILKEYRDGIQGLLLSLAFGIDKLFFHLKLWELEIRKNEVEMRVKKIPQRQFNTIYSQVPRLCVDVIIQVGKGIVFLKRDVLPYKGKWAIPGATVLLGEKLEDAVKRVANAKIGVKVKIEKSLGVVEFLINPNSHCLSLVYLVTVVSGEIKNDDRIKIFLAIPQNMVEAQAKFLRDKLNFK